MDYAVIDHSSSGVKVTTDTCGTLAGDGTPIHIEMVSPSSREDKKGNSLLAPYRVIDPVIAETASLTDLDATDPRLIDCSGYSELQMSIYTQPTVPLGEPQPDVEVLCVAYLLKDDGKYAPVAVFNVDTTWGFNISNNATYDILNVSVDGSGWCVLRQRPGLRVGVFDKVALFLSRVPNPAITKVAICYTLA